MSNVDAMTSKYALESNNFSSNKQMYHSPNIYKLLSIWPSDK